MKGWWFKGARERVALWFAPWLTPPPEPEHHKWAKQVEYELRSSV